jgi:hypothetical protein
MKHLKIFESIKIKSSKVTDIEIGDYVIVKVNYKLLPVECSNFINNNVGRLLNEDDSWENFLIGYENIPENLTIYFREKDYNRTYKKKYYTRWINSDRVILYDKSYDDVLLKYNALKYNI